MQLQGERLSEVRLYFENGDTHVGYRRLLDLAIETGDMTVYERTLRFCDWYDAPGHSLADINEQVADLLQVISLSNTPAAAVPDKPLIRMSEVHKKYRSGNFSLRDIELSLFPGQIIGLVGENGNGKTTLLRLLYGELKPDNGSIEYNMKGLSQGDSYDTKTRLGFIPQRPNPWYGSLMDNLQFTSTHYGFKGRFNFLWTEMICARMGLRAFRTYNWNRISSGFKMRFELARAIIKKPEVLLLDEPLANLDVLAQQVVLEDLRFLAQSHSMPIGIILSSQQLYEVEKVSQQVIFLKEGKPRYQHMQKDPEQESLPTVFELETSSPREKLQEIFASVGLQQISFNGGVYLLYFQAGVKSSEIIRLLGEAEIPVKYFRDISSSSRRFFNA